MTVIPITSAPGFAGASEAPAPGLLLAIAPQAVHRMRHAPEAKSPQALNQAEALLELSRATAPSPVELAGPGDPLATAEATCAFIALLRQQYPELHIGLTTLGLGGAEHASALAAAGLNSATVLIDTLDAATAEQLYAWIRPGKKTMPLDKAAALLVKEQSRAVSALATLGVTVTIRTTVYPGINAHRIAGIAEAMAALGAAAMDLVSFLPGPQQADAPPAATRVHLEQIAKLTGRFLPTTARHLAAADCGCDCGPACGTGSTCGCSLAPPSSAGLPRPTPERPRVAVASATGLDIDLHLGQARQLLIYGPRADGLTCLLETRQAPEAGSGETRWDQLADTLHDCFAVLAASAGQRPREVLAGRSIRVLLTEDGIEGVVDTLYGGGKKGCGKK